MNNIVDFAGIGTVFSINEFVSRGRPRLGPNASLRQANVSTVNDSNKCTVTPDTLHAWL